MPQNNSSENILSVRNLCISFATDFGLLKAVDGVSFDIPKGKTLGLVGESGCGKSVTSLSIMRLLPQPAGRIPNGEILFEGKDMVKATPEELYGIRGSQIAMIFQEPMSALNPIHTIERQLSEMFQIHFPKLSKKEIRKNCIDLLNKVGIPEPVKRLKEYPHQLSGGMRQRVMIAMALSCKPKLLIADEPTTALDVTVQAQILLLMKELQEEYGMSILFITHDLGVVAQMCDEVVVMYAGRVAEKASVSELYKSPKHPYTNGLLGSLPRFDTKRKSTLSTIPGMVPSLSHMPEGCRFQNRCPKASDKCTTQPELKAVSEQQLIACHHWQENTQPGENK